MSGAAAERKYWLTSGMFTLLQRFGVQLFGLGMVPIVFRSFGDNKDAAGIWFLFLTGVSILEVGRMGLQQNALIKYLSDCEEEDYAKISTASFILNFIVTAVMVLALLALSEPIGASLDSPEMTTMLRIYCLTTVLLIPFFQSNFMGQANLDFKGMFWSDFIRQGLLFFYMLVVFMWGSGLDLVTLAQVQVLTAVVASLVAYFFAKPYMRFKKTIDWKWVKELFRYGKFVMGTNLSTMVYKSIDKFMLAFLLSPAAVTAYEAAIKVTNMAEIPTFSMAAILFPQSARRMKEGKTVIKELYEKAVGAIFALLVPGIIFVLIFAEWIIWIVAGEKYLDSAYLLRLTILYGLFIPFAVQFGTVLDSIGKPKINFWFTLGGALLNVILNFAFISHFGIVGAAYGTLVTYLVAFCGMQYILYKMLNVKAYRVFYYMFDFYGQIWEMIKSKLGNNSKKLKNSEIS